MTFDHDSPREDGRPLPVTAREEDIAGSQLFEKVLRETIGIDATSCNEAILTKLLEVRRRRAHEPFAVTPVGEEMVAAALSCRFGERSWRAMSTTIASTLGEDPVASARLQALWDSLSTVQGGA